MTGRWRREAALVAGSVIITFIVGEAASRLILPPAFRVDPSAVIRGRLHRPDPRIGWVLTQESLRFPHRLVDNQGNVQYDVVYSVEGGQRRTSEQPPAGPVLVAAGCSFTFGHGLNDRDTWPWLLQEKLPNYHVVNVGCMGYGTDQALLAAERQLLQAPGKTALVVLGFADFQIERNRSPQGWIVHVFPFSKPLFAIGPDGVDYQRQVRFWSLGAADHSDLFAHIANTLANRVYRIPSHDGARELTAALITGFAKRFEALGARLAVVVLPYVDDRSPQSRDDLSFMVERLQIAGVPVLVPEFPRLPGGRFDVPRYMVSRIDRHPNREYNLVLTDQLHRFLEARGITKP